MEKERKIKTNKAQCLVCLDIIESVSVHDFVECSCGEIHVDGGKDYLRRGFKRLKMLKELSEYEEDCKPQSNQTVTNRSKKNG